MTLEASELTQVVVRVSAAVPDLIFSLKQVIKSSSIWNIQLTVLFSVPIWRININLPFMGREARDIYALVLGYVNSPWFMS